MELKLVAIEPSHNKDKKYDAIFRDKKCPCKNNEEVKCGRGEKIVSFGAKGYEDYTMHKDPERKKRYLTRHKKTENWNDPTTPGSLSRWILWNKPSLTESISDFKKHFNL